MKKYFILASLTLLCCMFFSCSSDDDAEKDLDLTGTWYMSSYEDYDYEDGKVLTVTVPQEEVLTKKIFSKKTGQVYDVITMQRSILPNEFGEPDFENPKYGNWEFFLSETYDFQGKKLFTDHFDYDVVSVSSKKIILGADVHISADEPNKTIYLKQTYSKMD